MENSKKHLSLGDFEKDKNLLHKSYKTDVIEKAEPHKTHKYLRKEGDRYIYHESYQKDSGAKFHHHEMMYDHHLGEYYNAKNKLNSSLDNLMSGSGPVESPEHYIKAATHHAEKAAYHNSQKSKYFHEAIKDYKNSGVNTHGEIMREHNDAGISPETYAKAYYEHEAKKEAKKNEPKDDYFHQTPEQKAEYDSLTDKQKKIYDKDKRQLGPGRFNHNRTMYDFKLK